MSPQRWQRVREVFDKAAACAPSETDEVLREACGEDTKLYDEVRRMLAEHERSSPLDRAVWEGGSLGVFSAGQTVGGRYRIIRYLSRGGMGEVYEAQDLELGERVALKTLLPEVANDARMIARFKQEIQLSRKIGHPNVCRVFDLARHPADGSSPDTIFFLTMEFLAGETLAARLEREGRMAPAQALPLLEQIAEALDAAHRAGVVHRDLKPSNVMLTQGQGALTPRAVVTDFGLARSYTPEKESSASLSGRIMGTVDYMAPELLTGAQATFASDIYALGMVAYKMVTGVLPFATDTPLAAAILRSKEPLPSPKAFVAGLDPKWERAILRSLDTNPARRFETAAQFVAVLRGESTAIRLAVPEMNRRTWAAVVGAALLAVGAWFGWNAWAGARHRPSPEAEALYQKGVDDIGAGAYFAATRALEEAVKQAPHFALAHARLAEAWVELEMPEKAQEQMLLARREDISRLAQADRLQLEAIDLTITREFSAAVSKYEQIARLAGGRAGDLAVDLGRAHEKAGQTEKAIEAYRPAAEGDGHSPAAWLRLGALYSRESNAAKSDQAFDEAEKLYQLTSNLEGATEIAMQRGLAANSRGRPARAEELFTQAFETARIAGNVQQQIRAKAQLSVTAYALGDQSLAERYANEGLAAAQSNQMGAMAVRGLVNLGNAFRLKGDKDGAERYYRQALALARESNASRLIAFSLLSLAALLDQERRPDEATQAAREALAFYEPNRFARESQQALTILGRSQLYENHYADAVGLFQRLLVAAESVHDRYQMALAYESMGSALNSQELYPSALIEFQRGLAVSDDPQRTGYSNQNVAYTLYLLGRDREASAQFDKAEQYAAKFPALRMNIDRARAEVELSEGHYQAAASLASAVLREKVQDVALAGPLRRTLGLALVKTGQSARGLEECENALAVTTKGGNVRDILRVRVVLARAQLAAGHKAAAAQALHEVESTIADYPESGWQALAVLAAAEPVYVVRANAVLDDLRKKWGEEAVKTYLSRPDNTELSRPLLQSKSANR